MTARRFKLEIAGQTVFGLAFGSEQELDAFLAARAVVIKPAARIASPAPRIAIENTPRPRGRPSYDGVIVQAIRALGRRLKRNASVSEHARLVLTHIAQTISDPAEIPAARTVREYLSARAVGGKVGGNSGEKSTRARLPRTGGRSTC